MSVRSGLTRVLTTGSASGLEQSGAKTAALIGHVVQKERAMEALGSSLALLGAVSVVAALVSHVKGFDIEIATLPSRSVRAGLFAVGLAFIILGLTLVVRANEAEPVAKEDAATSLADPQRSSESGADALAVYKRAANAACLNVIAQFNTIRTPDPSDVNGTLAYMNDSATALDNMAAALSQVEVPASVASDHTVMIATLRRMANLGRSAISALQLQEADTAKARMTELSRVSGEFDRAANALNLNSCSW